MNPLFEKYFRGELTDLEETTLEKLLAESEDHAWEFGQEAEKIYVGYGLPEPDLPKGSGGAASGGLQIKLWLGLGLALVLLGGYWCWSRVVSTKSEVVMVQQTGSALVKKVTRRAQAPVVYAIPTMQVEPPPESPRITESGNNLNVVVKRTTAGPAIVRVVNEANGQVRLLYDGELQTGRWGFEWDGRSQDGRLVDPGKYRIVVETGGIKQSREVVIH